MENENMPVIQEEEKAGGQKATKRMPRIGLPVSGRIHIPCKGRKDIEFTGRLLAEEEEAHKKNPKNKDRWTRLSVYEVDTTGKTRVSVAVASHLPFPGKNVEPVYVAEVCRQFGDLDKVFKDSTLKKNLYEKLGISHLMVETLN